MTPWIPLASTLLARYPLGRLPACAPRNGRSRGGDRAGAAARYFQPRGRAFQGRRPRCRVPLQRRRQHGRGPARRVCRQPLAQREPDARGDRRPHAALRTLRRARDRRRGPLALRSDRARSDAGARRPAHFHGVDRAARGARALAGAPLLGRTRTRTCDHVGDRPVRLPDRRRPRFYRRLPAVCLQLWPDRRHPAPRHARRFRLQRRAMRPGPPASRRRGRPHPRLLADRLHLLWFLERDVRAHLD